ncbi:hypothetical protein MBOL_00490 [Mycobacteroides abscessus subsp. bolletii BD]|nr:hypothetical protein MBOL_00490 [Mycobacteroides abscessus subsp. bolletii BD]
MDLGGGELAVVEPKDADGGILYHVDKGGNRTEIAEGVTEIADIPWR